MRVPQAMEVLCNLAEAVMLTDKTILLKVGGKIVKRERTLCDV